MIENKNDVKIKRARNSNPESQCLDNLKKKDTFFKDTHTCIKKSYSNHIEGTTGEESRSKSPLRQRNKNRKKFEKKSCSIKNKKKDKERFSKLSKNERMKIPTGKRTSIGNNNLKLNLNNLEKIIKSLSKERKDSFGNLINKNKKKNFHIRFLDNIPSNKLIEIIPIESFKEFNVVEEMPNREFIQNCSNCCKIF